MVEVIALMRKAEILDAQEDQRYGKGNRGSDLPDELRRRQDRPARIRQARKEMEAETAAAAARQRHEAAEEERPKAAAARGADAPAAEQAGLEPPDLGPLAADAMPRRGLARRADGTPTGKSQRNHRFAEGFADTDPDSHLMKSDGHFIQGYNCQLAVESDYQGVVAVGVSNQQPDTEHLGSILERIAANADALPDVMSLDAGYWSEDDANGCADQDIDAYIATGRLPHGQPPPPKRGPLPKGVDARTRKARKIRSKKGARIYARR